MRYVIYQQGCLKFERSTVSTKAVLQRDRDSRNGGVHYGKELKFAACRLSNLIKDKQTQLRWRHILAGFTEGILSIQAHLSAFPGFPLMYAKICEGNECKIRQTFAV